MSDKLTTDLPPRDFWIVQADGSLARWRPAIESIVVYRRDGDVLLRIVRDGDVHDLPLQREAARQLSRQLDAAGAE